ncbi:TlpA disulfide reductase family protein [Mucilaginibacter sp. CSA2-8R]|uniref:peroxiredoxin family protein n=1 Tax=Mucilaginibacter sp. CSA2-8R TaxID=3141542 RepID=UPI00315D3E4B
MIKYLSVAALLGISLSAFSQQTDLAKYVLPDGKAVTHSQLDSVDKAWGGHGYLMKHSDTDPDAIAVSPMTDEYLKKQADEKEKLNALLNNPAPDFTLTDLGGKKWTLAALKGKTVVLNFWFTTCPPCIQEMPELNALAKNYNKGHVVFLALGRNSAPQIKSFLKVHPFNYTHFPDADSVGNLYQINSYPTSIVIDREGIIRFIQVGGKNIQPQIDTAIHKIVQN